MMGDVVLLNEVVMGCGVGLIDERAKSVSGAGQVGRAGRLDLHDGLQTEIVEGREILGLWKGTPVDSIDDFGEVHGKLEVHIQFGQGVVSRVDLLWG